MPVQLGSCFRCNPRSLSGSQRTKGSLQKTKIRMAKKALKRSLDTSGTTYSTDNGDIAHDAAVNNAEWGEVKAPWADPSVSYSTVKTSEIDKPRRVDVAV